MNDNITRMKRIIRNLNNNYVFIKESNNESYYAMLEHEYAVVSWIKIDWTKQKLIDHFLKNDYVLLRKEITTEVDWLNAIQDNFKEGV